MRCRDCNDSKRRYTSCNFFLVNSEIVNKVTKLTRSLAHKGESFVPTGTRGKSHRVETDETIGSKVRNHGKKTGYPGKFN